MLGDLRNPRWMYLKGILFVGIGLLSSTLLLMDQPSLRTAALLTLTVWAFCRAYYFAFYVVEKYVDSTYRFAGLIDFAKYLLRRQPR